MKKFYILVSDFLKNHGFKKSTNSNKRNQIFLANINDIKLPNIEIYD